MISSRESRACLRGGGFTIPCREKFAPPRAVRSVELDRFGGLSGLGSFEAPDGYFDRASSEVNEPGVDILKSSSFGLLPPLVLRALLALRFAVRALNRLREHTLEVVRTGIFHGQHASLTRRTDDGCDWNGWFTDTEIRLAQPVPGTESILLMVSRQDDSRRGRSGWARQDSLDETPLGIGQFGGVGRTTLSGRGGHTRPRLLRSDSAICQSGRVPSEMMDARERTVGFVEVGTGRRQCGTESCLGRRCCKDG